jgi:hypothetical protein
MTLPFVEASSPFDCMDERAKGARMDSTSAISPSPAEKPKSIILDCLLGNRTLSSLALPTFVLGSSCSRSIENLADKLVMRRLVRKSSVEGRAVARSISILGSSSGAFFFPNILKGLEDSDSIEGRGASSSSLAFFLFLNRFIMIDKTQG